VPAACQADPAAHHFATLSFSRRSVQTQVRHDYDRSADQKSELRKARFHSPREHLLFRGIDTADFAIIGGLGSRGTQDAQKLFIPANSNFTRARSRLSKEENMGRGILLWLLGVPIPIIILLALFWH
jgi:hypothetical protein